MQGTKARTACIESVSAFNTRTILSKKYNNCQRGNKYPESFSDQLTGCRWFWVTKTCAAPEFKRAQGVETMKGDKKNTFSLPTWSKFISNPTIFFLSHLKSCMFFLTMFSVPTFHVLNLNSNYDIFKDIVPYNLEIVKYKGNNIE